MIPHKSIAIVVLILATVAGFASGRDDTGTYSPTRVEGKGRSTASGVQYWDIVVGTGATADRGKTVGVHYTGWLANGMKFDSSVDRGKPVAFPLGAGRVIRGWDDGIVGMKVGGKRQLRIPPDLGYGFRGSGVVPPNSILIFDVQLLTVGK
jgi:FKBP-type peptidyl-prolyl cis-trans isomerase